MISVSVLLAALAATASAQEPSRTGAPVASRTGEPVFSRTGEPVVQRTGEPAVSRTGGVVEGSRTGGVVEGSRTGGVVEGSRTGGVVEGSRTGGWTRSGDSEGTRAGTRSGDDRPGDDDIRSGVPECQNLCTLESCRTSTVADCRSVCATKLAACQTAAAAAVRSKWEDAADDFKQRVEDARTRAGDVAKLTLADVKAKCNAACDERAGDRATQCKAQCDKIGEGSNKGGDDAAKVVAGACRERFEDAVKKHEDDEDSQEVKDAVEALKDAVADRRALFDAQRATVAAALDDAIAAWKAARQVRQDKIAAARAAAKDLKDKLDAATTDEEKAKIRADAKAEVEKAIEDAKAARDAAKAAWSDKRLALVQSVIDAHKDRRDARRVIIADCKNVKEAVEDVKAAAQGVDPAAQVTTSTDSTGSRKRGTSVTIIVSCDQADESCGQALNNVVSGAVSSSADVKYTETTPDEVDYQSPVIPSADKDAGSAASLALGAVTTLVALVASLL